MDILKVMGVGLIAVILSIVLKQHKPEIAVYISIVTGLMIFFLVLNKLNYVVQVLNNLSSRANINFIYFSTVLRILGIAYLTEFVSQIARDCGENSIASKIEMAGKIIILFIAIPILVSVIDLIIKILPS